MSPRQERPGLGRGLASLIPGPTGATEQVGGVSAPAATEIELAKIKSNPYQPRLRMEQEALEALAASIREHGVIQPVLLTRTGDGYQLIAGERRVRAAQMAGLTTVPAVIREAANHAQLELAIVENVVRADLDPMEEAHAYRQLIDEFGMTQEKLAARFGRARSTIANSLRLLDTDPTVQAAVAARQITEGHARAIAGLPAEGQRKLVPVVIAQDLSVRATEELVRRVRDEQPKTATSAPSARPTNGRAADPDLERVEEELRRSLGTKVSLVRSRRGGRIVIEYYSDEELGRIYDRLIGGTL